MVIKLLFKCLIICQITSWLISAALALFTYFFTVCVIALYERMRADQRKFGKSAWTAAVERMERLQFAVSKETLQLMRAKEICLEQRKHGLKEEVKHNMLMLLKTPPKTNHTCGPRSVSKFWSVSGCVLKRWCSVQSGLFLRSHNKRTWI